MVMHKRSSDEAGKDFQHHRNTDVIVEELQREHIDMRNTLQNINHVLEQLTASLKEVSNLSMSTDRDLRGWVRYFQGGLAVFAVVALFGGWIILEKNADIKSLQSIAVTNQGVLVEMGASLKAMNLEVQSNKAEQRRQADVDVQLYQMLIQFLAGKGVTIPQPPNPRRD